MICKIILFYFYPWIILFSYLLSFLFSTRFFQHLLQTTKFSFNFVNLRRTSCTTHRWYWCLSMLVWWLSRKMGLDYELALHKNVVGIRILSVLRINNSHNKAIRVAEIGRTVGSMNMGECACWYAWSFSAARFIFGCTKIVHFANLINSSGLRGLTNLSDYVPSYCYSCSRYYQQPLHSNNYSQCYYLPILIGTSTLDICDFVCRVIVSISRRRLKLDRTVRLFKIYMWCSERRFSKRFWGSRWAVKFGLQRGCWVFLDYKGC